METSTLIEYSSPRQTATGVTRDVNDGFFLSPASLILGTVFTLFVLLATAFYFFPLITTITAAAILLILKLALTRRNLTFYDEQYSPDVFVEEIEDIRA